MRVRRCAPEHLLQDQASFSRANHEGARGLKWLSFSFSHPALECKLKTLYPPRFYQFNIKSALAQYKPHQPLFTPLGIPRHKMRFIIIYVVGHKITETNCSWHKFFKLLLFLQNYTILLHFTTNIPLRLTIVQPFSLAW